MNGSPNKIKNGSKIAIVGGGPAGSFFALYLLHFARQRGIQPDITIYQGKDFMDVGSKGCKGCAGILAPKLVRNLNELNLTIPEEIIQRRILHYTVHSPYTSITISAPEGFQIISVYRGGGPRASHYDKPVSFDGWLLQEAKKSGAKIEFINVSAINLRNSKPCIDIESTQFEYDLVALASGVNGRAFEIHGLNYLPPRKETMAQDELYAGAEEVEARLGGAAHAFLIPHSGLVFGSLVPKGHYINVSVLSHGKNPVSVKEFLDYDIVRKMLPEHYEHSCGCKPRAAVTSARNYYANGFVAVGDASVSRLYKDGIGSSLQTAREAARTVVFQGFTRDDFKRYYQPFCKAMVNDNRWGKILFSINDIAKDSRAFLRAQHRLIGNEQNNAKGPQSFTRATWGMFTGSYSYAKIASMTLGPVSLFNLSLAYVGEGVRSVLHKGPEAPKTLHVGSKKVLILGSGFGGTYVLRRLVPRLNLNENVETTMVSYENFFLFAPLLHEVAMGKIETRHIAYPIRRLHWRDRFNFVQAIIEKIDLKNRKVYTTAGTLDYDYLVLSLGNITDMSGLNSKTGNIFTLKSLSDSMLIRNHIIETFERASGEKDPQKRRELLTFVVSGAGYTGIQLVAELRDFLFKGLTGLYRTINPEEIRIILVEISPKIVSEMHTKLGAYIMDHLVKMGIEIRLKSHITRVWDDHIEINGNESVSTRTLIWASGWAANPRIAALDAPKDEVGRVIVNDYLQVSQYPGVYAIGDCAHFKDPKSGQPIPPRAHTTVRQAKVAASNILADIRGRDKKPYIYTGNPEMVSLGSSKAVFRFHKIRLYGRTARLIWLAGYSLLVTGAYNRVRILIDWGLSAIFGRDTTYLRLLKR